MDAEAAAPLGDVDDAGDEVGDLLDERGELVDDDHQRGRGVVGELGQHLLEVLGPALHDAMRRFSSARSEVSARRARSASRLVT